MVCRYEGLRHAAGATEQSRSGARECKLTFNEHLLTGSWGLAGRPVAGVSRFLFF